MRSSSETAECLLAQRLPPILQKFNEEKANMKKHYHEIVSVNSLFKFLFLIFLSIKIFPFASLQDLYHTRKVHRGVQRKAAKVTKRTI